MSSATSKDRGGMDESVPRQPLLNDSVVALSAPTQVWSRPGGDTSRPIDGIFYGDVRHLRRIALTSPDSEIEWISTVSEAASQVNFSGLLRGVDDATPDPKVRLLRRRRSDGNQVREEIQVISALAHPLQVTLRLELEAEFAPLAEVKDGRIGQRTPAVVAEAGGAVASFGGAQSVVQASGAVALVAGNIITFSWTLEVAPRSTAEVAWSVQMTDPSLVVAGAASPWPALELAPALSPDLRRWLQTAWSDLGALRMTLPGSDQEFLAAGAPWFFTLFGRDSLWAARLLLRARPELAVSTLAVLAGLQGTEHNPETAEAPGKILHELRAAALHLPGEGIVLPPIYYGSVDSTPLWICLLHDAWRAGAPWEQIAPLIPALSAALTWLVVEADGDGDGFLDYIDRNGRGLSNQGWKDSGDSIQWRDGTLADGPIALCEVQGYAYEAALGGAALLEAAGVQRGGISPARLRTWAAELKQRFAADFWVETPEGRYPAIALDGSKRRVDSLTSNIGHLLGTGILSEKEEGHIAELLLGGTMSSGFGVRTMSTEAAGYWPLSYHCGSVWTHDNAIIAWGMQRSGQRGQAREVVDQMIRAAACFDYRVPELHCGESAAVTSKPSPYPAACCPQAWSAAAAVVCQEIYREEN